MDTRGEDPKWTTYGWQKIRPAFLQRFHTPRFLTIVTIFAQWAHGMLIGGFIPLSIRMLRQRFNMSRNEVSMITSSFEAASVTALIIVSHRGNYGHKGQWIGFGLVIFSIGALLWTIPQYLIGPHTFSDWVKPTLYCAETPPPPDQSLLRGNLHMRVEHSRFVHFTFMFIFLIAQVLIAIGTAPLAVLAPAYIDENVSQRKSPLYLSALLAGMGIGELLGGSFASVYMDIYGDIGKIDVEGLDISPNHPNWYGAWWLGFLTAGIFGFLVSVLYLGFSSHLPGSQEERADDPDQSADHVEVINDYTVPSIPVAIWSLLRNRTYTCILGAGMLYNALISSTTLNLPYLFKSYFHMPDNSATTAAALLVIIPQGLGAIIAGFLFYHFCFKLQRMLQFSALMMFILLLLVPTFLLYCDNPKVAGVNVDYSGNVRNETGNINLNDGCNRGCFPSCPKFKYHPVCHKPSGTSFYSPCFAGCRNEIGEGILDVKGWSNCRCTPSSTPDGEKVVDGICTNTCTKFKLFIFFMILIGLASGMSLPGFQQGYLRCVGFDQRVMGLTVAFVFSRLFGLIPGQFVMKTLLKQACSRKDPLLSGKCIIPDKAKLGELCSAYNAIVIAGVLLCFLTASYVYKTKQETGLPHNIVAEEDHVEQNSSSDYRPEEDQM